MDAERDHQSLAFGELADPGGRDVACLDRDDDGVHMSGGSEVGRCGVAVTRVDTDLVIAGVGEEAAGAVGAEETTR
jgi:hypothetical protein